MGQQYVLKKTIVKHEDSVNTLAFSYDGSMFASGGDDGLVIVFRGNGSGRELCCFQLKAPIMTLLWHSRFSHTVIAGDASGDIHTICLNGSTNISTSHFLTMRISTRFCPQRNLYYHTINEVPGPVHSIVQSATMLAISSGKFVQLIKQGTIGSFHYLLCSQLGDQTWLVATWEVVAQLPDPPKFPELEGELPEPMARSLHFLGANADVLLVTYLDHGVMWAFGWPNSYFINRLCHHPILIEHGTWKLWTSNGAYILDPVRCMTSNSWLVHVISHSSICFSGCSAVSPNQKVLAVTNLYDGIDWYSLDSNHFVDTSFLHTTPHAISGNCILPVTFIHNGTAVLSGMTTGCARITRLKDYSLVESLQHDCEWL